MGPWAPSYHCQYEKSGSPPSQLRTVSPFKRQTVGGGPVVRSASTQCCAAVDRRLSEARLGHVASDFSPLSSIAMSPSPFSALLFVTRRSSAQGAPS